MLDAETKRRIDNARQVLVGKIPSPQAQVEQITTALIYKFMDDMDQEAISLDGKASFFIGDLKEFSWSRLMSKELGGQARLILYMDALTKFASADQIPELFRKIFKDAFLPYRDPETLNLFLKEINYFSYEHSENLGNAFEYLLSVLGSQGDAGQFRTPRHIIDFIVDVVDPKKSETILDPACGTAGFLISAYKHIRKLNSSNYSPKEDIPTFAAQNTVKDVYSVESQNNGKYKGDRLTPKDKEKLMANIIGYDISPDMQRLSLVNMYLHGFREPKIFEYDTLTSQDKWNDNFDVILANPPFMTPKGGIKPHNKFQVQANRAEVLFVDYIAEHLNVNGRGGIIVPEGIIFQSNNAYTALRKMLVDNNLLYAVVSLPSGVFNPYSGVKTSILFLDKQLAKQNDEILFIKVGNDGFDLGAQRRSINKNDLPEAYDILRVWQKGEKIESKIGNWVSKAKVAENGDYNLSSDRYIEAKDYTNCTWSLVKLGDVCELYQPKTITSNEIESVGLYKVFGANGIIGFYDKYNHEESEVLVTCRGATCGVVNKSEPKSWITGNAMVIKPKKENDINKDFLFYILTNTDLTPVISGAAQPQITRQNISPFKIPLPPLEVQEEIVKELEGYQAVIDGAKKVVESWKPTLPTNPAWQKVKLGDICDVRDGTHDTPKYISEGVPLITSKNLIDGDIDFNNINYISLEDHINISKRSGVDNGDVLFAMIGTIGSPVIVRKNRDFSIKNIALFKVGDNNSHLNNIYLKYLLENKTQELQNISSGVTQKFVSLKILRELEIKIPPLEEQKKIVAQIEEEETAVNECKKLIATMEQKIQAKISTIWGESSDK